MKKNYQGGLSSILVWIWKVILRNKIERVGKERERQKANTVCINVLFNTVDNWSHLEKGRRQVPV